ncbi:HTH-type transcriptional regulator XynR [Moorella humiferrea]|uniref:IclR family transcriptional regulator n=1 Tax=Neomoorella humiferrea TaxID=676965 RepID=UPI0030CF60BF
MVTTRIRSVAKALTILDLLAAHQGDMSLGEIARALDLPKSTLHGLLATLRDFGYLEQSPFDGRYRLGVRLFEIGNIVANNWDVRKVAAPHIQKLVDELEETVHLVVLDKGEVLYIDKRESRQSLRIVSQVGMRLPAHCTGVGKVLLAYLHPSEVKRIIATKGLARYTRHTITDPRQLEAELAKIREMGYAVDNEEIMDSLRCVAAPIRNHNGKVCAAVSVSGPVARLEGEKFRLAVEQVVRTAAEISAGLGYRPAVGSDISGT